MCGVELTQVTKLQISEHEALGQPRCLERLVWNPAVAKRYSELSGARRQTGGGRRGGTADAG
jgi:hypothetical protein